jgi:hypothetical protein
VEYRSVGKIKLIAGLCGFALIAAMGWQIASCEFHNYLLKDDLKDVAAMGASKIGMAAPRSDKDLRAAVIRKAGEQGIHLAPEQILVRRSGSADDPVVFLAVRYQQRVVMPGFALIFHYTATSKG